MTPHERALLAVYDLREIDTMRKELERRWTDFVIACYELEWLVGPQEGVA